MEIDFNTIISDAISVLKERISAADSASKQQRLFAANSVAQAMINLHKTGHITVDPKFKKVTSEEKTVNLHEVTELQVMQRWAHQRGHSLHQGGEILAELIGELRKPAILKGAESLHILAGQDIEQAYAEKYLNSCMHASRGHRGSNYLNAYRQSGVRMIAVRNNGELIARALLWNAVDKAGNAVRYLDRMYGCSRADRIGRFIIQFALNSGASVIYQRDGNNPVKHNLWTVLNHNGGLPYIDSFAHPVLGTAQKVIAQLETGPLRDLNGNRQNINNCALTPTPSAWLNTIVQEEVSKNFITTFEQNVPAFREMDAALLSAVRELFPDHPDFRLTGAAFLHPTDEQPKPVKRPTAAPTPNAQRTIKGSVNKRQTELETLEEITDELALLRDFIRNNVTAAPAEAPITWETGQLLRRRRSTTETWTSSAAQERPATQTDQNEESERNGYFTRRRPRI